MYRRQSYRSARYMQALYRRTSLFWRSRHSFVQFVYRRQKLNSINRCIYIDIRKFVSSLCRRVMHPYRALQIAKLARFDSRWQHHQRADSQLETWERHCFSPHETFIGRYRDTVMYVRGPIINQLIINAVSSKYWQVEASRRTGLRVFLCNPWSRDSEKENHSAFIVIGDKFPQRLMRLRREKIEKYCLA